MQKIFFLCCIFSSGFSSGAFAASHTITMKSISYDPKLIEIDAGDKVEWVNKSYTDHSATAKDGESFETGLVAPQKTSKVVVFERPGTYDYHCSIHGNSMRGRIIVKPPH